MSVVQEDASVDAAGAADNGPMGATPHAGGVHFRVWAENAARVFVSGDFNHWSTDENELSLEPGQIFGGDVAGAMVGQQYAYVVVGGDGSSVTRADPRARSLTSTSGHAVILDSGAYAWQTPSFVPADATDTVIYELHLGTFNRASPSLQSGWTDAAKKLDHLSALGVSAVEIMPPAMCGTASSWGYNPSWPYAAHLAYGTPDDARAFIDAAHARGIAVYIDVVHNHYTAKPGLGCWDGDCEGYQGAYFYTDAATRATPWGPRPDYGDVMVRAFIRDNALMWLGDEYRADGLRWDSTVNMRATGSGGAAIADGWSLLVETNDAVHALPHKLQIAEDLQGDAQITAPTGKGGAGFDAQWDAAFYNPVDAVIVAAADSDRDMNQIQGALSFNYNGSCTQRIIYTEDHDQDANGRSRIPSMISPSAPGSLAARQRSTVGAAVVMTAPGVPMIFMGQEFLESGSFSDTNPLDWSKTTTYSGILAMYTDLIALRRNRAGHTQGLRGNNLSVFHVNDNAKVVAYRRWDKGGAGDDVIVLANFGGTNFPEYDLGLPSPGAWHVRLSTNDTRYSPDFPGTPTVDVVPVATARDGFAQMGKMVLGPYQVLVLSQ